MYTHELKSVVFSGMLRPTKQSAVSPGAAKPKADGPPLNYSIVSQSREELRLEENSPSVSMWPYLLASAQTQRLNEISIYSEAGTTADKIRFLYMNDLALTIWQEMQKNAKVIGRLHRPPRGAVLAFGMPFSE